MPLSGLSDEELMARYQLGSEQAFSVLYDRHSPKVYAFIKKRVLNQERAAEVFQEVFVKLHRSKHLYNTTLPYLPWLFSVTRTVVLDSVKSQKKISAEVLEADFDHYEGEKNENQVLDLSPHLAVLPPVQREVIELRYVNEKTFEEIASILETSPVNARQLLSRGIKRLKELVFEGESHERRRK